jgi:dissimilatory sulfite reductase (desulfoviridin) alpha/beta subunit
MSETIAIVHNKVPARIRIRVPLIRNKRTLAELLKQSLLKDAQAKGIYHAEPNVTTGTFLIKYHPALHTEAEVVERVQAIARNIAAGTIEITAKHKNPRLGKMQPQAFFARELIVSIGGNVIAGFILAALISRG